MHMFKRASVGSSGSEEKHAKPIRTVKDLSTLCRQNKQARERDNKRIQTSKERLP